VYPKLYDGDESPPRTPTPATVIEDD